jgi:hypothetical protein
MCNLNSNISEAVRVFPPVIKEGSAPIHLKLHGLFGLFSLLQANSSLTSRQLDPSSKIGFVLQVPLPKRQESKVDSIEEGAYFIELHETDHLEGDSEEEACDLSMEEESLEYELL